MAQLKSVTMDCGVSEMWCTEGFCVSCEEVGNCCHCMIIGYHDCEWVLITSSITFGYNRVTVDVFLSDLPHYGPRGI